jgi:hypothetical protein
LKWFEVGPALTEAAIQRFEVSSGRKLPNSSRWLLTHECNGGWPGGEYFLPTDEPDSDYANLHCIYGIDNPNCDLLVVVQSWREFRQEMWPIGSDDFDGQFVLMLNGSFQDQIRFMPFEYFNDPTSDDHFFVAKNVQAFSQMLKSPSLPEVAG